MFDDKYKAVNSRIEASDDLKRRISESARNTARETVVNFSDFNEQASAVQKSSRGKLLLCSRVVRRVRRLSRRSQLHFR